MSRKTREVRYAQVRISPILALALFAFPPVKAPALEPLRPGQEGAIVRAVFVDKTLWTLSDAGELFRVAEADHELVKVPTEDPVLDLWIKDGVPTIVTSPRSDETPLTIRRWTGEEFRPFAGISTKQERLLGVSSNGDPTTLLTTRRTMEVIGNTIKPRDVDWPRTRPILGVTSILAQKDEVLLGINRVSGVEDSHESTAAPAASPTSRAGHASYVAAISMVIVIRSTASFPRPGTKTAS